MPKSVEFKDSLDKARRNFEAIVNEYALRRGEEFSKRVAERFVEEARKNLLSDSNPAPESVGLISSIASNITYTKSARTLNRKGTTKGKPKVATGYVVKIPMDREGLVMFLEYGTGLNGLRYKDKLFKAEASRIGWKYAINRENYKTFGTKRGFIFRSTGKNYIDNDDYKFRHRYLSTTEFVRGYIRTTKKTGKQTYVKGYRRARRTPKMVEGKKTWVLSSGITPVRFIYRAKNKVRQLISKNKI